MLRAVLAFVLVALLQPVAALRMPVHAVQQRAGRTLQPQMALPSMKDAETLSDEELNKEIVTAQKARRSSARPSLAQRSLRFGPRGLSEPIVPAPRSSQPSRPPPLGLRRPGICCHGRAKCPQLPTLRATQELFELRKKVKTRQEVRRRPATAVSPEAFPLPACGCPPVLPPYTRAGEAAPVHAHQAPHRPAQHAACEARAMNIDNVQRATRTRL